MENSMNVVLVDGTTGFCEEGFEVGQVAECWLHDENGNLISVIGEIAEIL